MEYVIQKAVELGVAEIVPVATDRCVVRLDEKKAKTKAERWNTIADAAAKQSKRRVIPAVKDVMSFKEAILYAGNTDIRLIPYELAEDFGRTRDIVSSLRRGQSVSVFIGPEGGFTEEEISQAEQAGITQITLGHRILRTETAAMVVLSWLLYETER